MSDDETWVSEQEQRFIREQAGGNGVNVDPGNMLTIGPVNGTIIDDEQAYALILADLAAFRFNRISENYAELNRYPYLTRTHQQLMAGTTNAREQYIRLGSAAIHAAVAFVKKEFSNIMGDNG